MARVKLTEYRAKSLLVAYYQGVALRLESINSDIVAVKPDISYIVKVDQGIKKRGKQGLIVPGVKKPGIKKAVQSLAAKGYTRFIAEPMVDHAPSEEQYLALERTREGITILHSETGGVDIEEHQASVKKYTKSDGVPLPQQFLQDVITTMEAEHIAFLEINPLVVKNGQCVPLDAAVLVDSAGQFESHWSTDDIVEATTQTETEQAIKYLNDNSPASFSFKILNKDGALWLLLSGGGASITIADEAQNQGKVAAIGNYGEYSGGPSTEETYLYAKHVLMQMRLSNAKSKALVIAGGVANFTDVKKTFKGIIQAIDEDIKQHGTQTIKVFVRRGGPNELEGLTMMRHFLEEHGICGSVHGSDTVLTDVVNEALEYVHV